MVVSTTYFKCDVGCACLNLPCACIFTSDIAISSQFNINRLSSRLLGVIQLILVYQQFVFTRNAICSYLLRCGNVGTLYLLTSILERSNYQPTVLALEYLVYTHLVAFTPVLETGMVYQIGATIFCSNDGVMTLRALTKISLGLIAP